MGNNSSLEHYDLSYFEWQRRVSGEFGGIANLYRFEQFIKKTDRVIDFGCGGGYLLANIDCSGKMGIEPNSVACEQARRNGIECVNSADELPDDWADVIISNSALEHALRPIDELVRLKRVLRAEGLAVFTVPHEAVDWKFEPRDVNQHLYTWSPLSLGNLFVAAGFAVERVDVTRTMWPPYARQVHNVIGQRWFRYVSTIYAALRRVLGWLHPVRVDADLRIVARKVS